MEQSTTQFVRRFKVKGKDLVNAGIVSTTIKSTLRKLGVSPGIVRRVSIASYEAEMNATIYAYYCDVCLTVDAQRILLVFEDTGPGIPDIDKAMQEGYSTASREVREMGFGAGMGLPNIKKNSDVMSIRSTPRVGTRLEFIVFMEGDR